MHFDYSRLWGWGGTGGSLCMWGHFLVDPSSFLCLFVLVSKDFENTIFKKNHITATLEYASIKNCPEIGQIVVLHSC